MEDKDTTSKKSPAHQALERAYSNPASDWLNPDNHDKVHIALGLVNFESEEKTRASMDILGDRIGGLTVTLAESMSLQVEKLIKSNEKTDKINLEAIEVNKQAIRSNRWLTGALVLVTLVVGLLQVYVLWKTSL